MAVKKQAFNPYLPSYEYIPDGEPRVFDGRVYVYGSHDRWNGEGFCLNDYVTWSAPVDDLGNWRYEGVIFRKDQDPMNPEGKFPLFAPDLVKGVDGRYYLYYSPAGMGTIGVAVCDTPGGAFEFHGHVAHADGTPVGMKEDDPNPFDPGVLVDDDGRTYLYFGMSPMRTVGMKPEDEAAGPNPDKKPKITAPPVMRKPGPHVVELAADMHSMIGEPQLLEITDIEPPRPGEWGHGFFEASSMRKVNGKYYFVYSSHNGHELCYAIGDKPMGPFKYGGVLHSNGDIGINNRPAAARLNYSGNNHGSLVQIGEQWYIFGHRMTNYNAFSRQAVAEPVTVLPDGSIPQVEMTSCGLNGGPLKGIGTYEARIACNLWSAKGALHVFGPELAASRSEHPMYLQDGEDREDTPNQYIGNLRNGSMAGFKYFDMGEATHISAVTRGAAGTLYIRLSPDGENAAQIPLTAGDDWHGSGAVTLRVPAGKRALYFVYQGEGAADFLSFTLA